MIERIIRFIFFGNYFVGILAIALSLETAFQLRIPFASITYYILISCATVMYYTYAYAGALQLSASTNPRTEWYRTHHSFVHYSQWALLLMCLSLGAFLLAENFDHILQLPLVYWLTITVIALSSILYYGLLPRSILRLNLRSTGWLKAFVIGFVWAGFVSLIPLVMLRAEGSSNNFDPLLAAGLFIKNWMFCTVNAIMFDMKDYEDDSNKQLKTFVVRFGLERTIFFILIPLSLIGIIAQFGFAEYRHFGLLPFMINLIPFTFLLAASYSMLRQKSIFYYLIVIDGIVFTKAICGIIAMHFVQT